jgi:hypothetical protein
MIAKNHHLPNQVNQWRAKKKKAEIEKEKEKEKQKKVSSR